MEAGYIFYYIEANLVCLIFFLILLIRSINSVDRQAKQRAFDMVLFFHILYYLSDCMWALVLKEILPKNVTTSSLVNFFNSLIMCYLAFTWFMYVEISQRNMRATIRKNKLLLQIPVLISQTLLIAIFCFRPGWLLDDQLECTPLYYAFFLLIPIMYIYLAAFRSFRRSMRKENFAYRKQHIACVIYPIVISAFGILQTIWLNAPLFCFGCTIMLNYIYLISQDDLVSLDPLTNLNNRVQLKRYASHEFIHSKDDKSNYYVVMMDLDHFKLINDRFGHVEGDRALQEAADAIRAGCLGNDLRPFIARYGGDEFILILKTENEEDIKRLVENIRQAFRNCNEKNKKGYLLTPSIGYVSFNGELTEFQNAVERADQALYEEKRSHYSEFNILSYERNDGA